MQNENIEKRGNLLIEQSRRTQDKFVALIHHRDFSFLMPIFATTAVLFVGLLTTQHKPEMNKYSFLGIGLMLLNLFIIPLYIWLVIRIDLINLRKDNNFYYRLFKKHLKNQPLDENDQKEFDKEDKKSEKPIKEDWLFNLIVFLFIIGLLIFLLSLYKIFFELFRIDFSHFFKK